MFADDPARVACSTGRAGARRVETPMAIRGIDHVYAETRHYEQAIAFWRALGFRVRDSWGDASHRACLLGAGRARVVLAEAGAAVPPQRPTVHLAIQGAAALGEKLARSDAVRVETPLSPTHWGTRWIRVTDPDGNLWALEEAPPPPAKGSGADAPPTPPAP
jgi:catechol 2,3-dioxygenase-like lactoylglutathione lyase family enzyme